MAEKKTRVSKTENFEFRLENFKLGYSHPKKSIDGKIFTLGAVVFYL